MIGPEKNMAKYALIAKRLRNEILVGKYKPGDRLPSGKQLSKRFKVAHLTIIRAIDELVKLGMVKTVPCSGIYVRSGFNFEDILYAEKQNGNAIRLIGLNSGIRGRANPANWAIRMLIYQGVMEAGGLLQIPVRIHDVFDKRDNAEMLIEELKDSFGIILFGDFINLDIIKKIAASGINIVTIDNPSADILSSVTADRELGAFLATEHLIEQGHRRIAFIGGLQTTVPMRKRFEGYKKALKKYGVELDEELLIFNTDGFPRDGAEAAVKLLERSEPPTAIFASSDYRAIGVIQKLMELNIDIPGEIAVVGYDNIPESQTQKPSLTTVDNPLYQCGAEAVAMLCRYAETGEVEHKTLPMTLVKRESS